MKRKIYKLLSSAKQGLFALALVVSGTALSQQSYTFAYTGALQTLTLQAGNWGIVSWGANGGDVTASPGGGGKGGYSQGAFNIVTPGTLLNILVGGKGASASGTGGPAGNGGWNGGGGGGYCGKSGGGGGGATDVRVGGTGAANRIIVAGGGGGSAYYNQMAAGGNGGAQMGQNGDYMTSSNVLTALGGGAGANGGAPGLGGFSTTNGTATGGGGGGYSPTGFGQPGTGGGAGGAGGTNAGGSTGGSGGGGGGYAGGAGGTQSVNAAVGGGGGSGYIGGVTSGTTIMFGQPGFVSNPDVTGNGRVIITELCSISLSTTSNPICAGNTITLTTNAVSGYSWSNGSTASSIVVTPSATAIYSIVGTSSANCSTGALITITVSTGLPVLSVTSSTNSLCLGKTVTLTASGALSYTWTNGVTNGVSYSPSVTADYTVTGENGCGTSTAVTSITVAPIQVSTISTPTLICASSPATLIALAPAVTYTWMPIGPQGATVVVNPSVTTIYTVTASDGTCSGTATLLLMANPIPTISIVASNSQVCEGFPVNMTASGGLSYTWMPGNLSGPSVTVYPTAPILYTVVGSNSFGCLAGAPQILLTDPSPTITVSANNTFVCPGTAVNIAAGGGSTYTWSTGPTTPGIAVNPTVTTSYNVVGTGQTGTCTATQTITIVVFNPAFTTTGPSTICSGSSATLISSGADSYLWDNGANVNLIVVSPTLNTIYTVGATTTSNNITCTATNTIQVTVSPRPIVTAASSRTLICKSESSILTAGGATSYTWNTSATSATITVTPTVPVLYTYSVTGTNANGCTNIATTQVKVNACNGINETAMKGVQLLVYPNPNKGEFMIETDSEITLNMVNELGQVVKTINLSGSNNFKASVSDLANGIYFMTGQNNSGKVNQKIVVNK